MSGPQRTQLATVSTVTPSLTDKAIVSQNNTVRASTFQSIYNLFKTGYDTVYTTTAAVAAQITAALTNYVTNSSLFSILSNYVTSSTFNTTLAALPKIESVEIFPSEVASLGSIPYKLITNPGANKAIQVLSCVVNFQNSTTGEYILGLQLQLQSDLSLSNIFAVSRPDFLGGINTSYTQYLTFQSASAQASNQVITSGDIYLSTSSDPTIDPFINPIDPLVTLKVYIIYQIIDVI